MAALLHSGRRSLGTLWTGARIGAEITITEHVRSAMNHRHEPIGRYVSFRFSGYATKVTKRSAYTHNVLPLIQEIVRPSSGLTLDDLKVLARLWEEWNCNDRLEGCGHDGCAGQSGLVLEPTAEVLVQITSFFPRWSRL